MSDNEFFGGRRRRRGNGGDAFSPYTLFASGEQGVWYDPSDLTPEKVSWRRNLLTYSQDFDNAAWTKSNASILSNLALYSQDFDNAAWVNQVAGTGVAPTRTANFATAPDGTMTADRLQFSLGGGTTTADFSYIAQAIIPLNIVHTGSFYVKLNSGTADIYVRTGNGSATYTVTSSWTRVEVACTAANTSSQFAIGLRGGQTPANTNTADILVWGAQLVPGSTAQTYTRSLATAAPIQFADPLGGTLADKLVEDTSLVLDHRLVSATNTFAVGTTYTSSLYAKAAERSFVRIFVLHVASTSFTVNLADGSIQFQSNSGNVTASATLVGNGWYRIQYTYLVTVASASAPIYAVIAYNATGTVTGTGNGTSGLLIFGAQAEQASTASAYQRITDFSSDFLAAFPTHALYQESTGVTPVTALGQSVGLVLDKRLGALTNQGSELITNGDFSSGSSGWTLGTGWSVGFGLATKAAGVGDAITRSATLTAGRVYRVSYTVSNATAGTCAAVLVGGTQVTGNLSSLNGPRIEYVVAVSGNNGAGITANGTFNGSVTNISVREVPGNHALQATSAARPTLQARGNLLTRTEEFDNAVWFNPSGTTVAANVATAPDGTQTADRIVNLNAAIGDRTNQSITIQNATLTGSIWLRGEGANIGKDVDLNVKRIGGTFVGTTITHTLTANWVRVSASFTQIAGNTGASFVIGCPASNAATDCLVWGAQYELGSTASTYQRVTTATDYADVGLPRNLTFDGVDDSLATAGNVDFSATDKVSLFSGLFKASDAAIGMVTELSASVSLNNGTFYLSAPNSAAGTNYAFVSKGTSSASQTTSATAPDTAVVTGLGNIGAPSAIIRRNGVQSSNATTQGTGNYGTYPLYVGRRGGSTLPFNGRLFQLVIRGAATDSVTVGNAERWVANLTGVTL